MRTHQSDILVIGSGLAGLLYAYHVTNNSDLNVTLITKRSIDQANTRHAQGGLAAVFDPLDNFDAHVEDTIIAGDYLCRKEVVREIIENGPRVIEELVALGVNFDQDKDGHLQLGREGGHHARRIIHTHDATGEAIHDQLVSTVKANPKIKVFEYHAAIDLVNIKNQVAGAYVLDIRQDEIVNFSARMTVMATGGAGKVFLYTSNPDIATGDGVAMAFRAGATVANMEFIQFHPTLWWNPKFKNFLITEAIRGEGGKLKSLDGNRFMKGVHELGELAPRDIVARAIDHDMKQTGNDYVFLDISHKPADFLKERFQKIYHTLMEFGTDMTKEPIPVVPAAHYTVGGIRAKVNGNTNVFGLLAIGEAAYTGLHGANRLASNSLLEAAVMAEKAAMHTVNLLKDSQLELLTFPEWESGDAVEEDEAVIVSHNWDELRRIMWNYVGIVRTNKRLLRAKQRILLLKDEVNEYYWKFKVSSNILELRNLVQVAELIVDSALARKESRGTHYNLDFLEKLDVKRDTLMQRRFGIFYSEEIN